MYKIIIIDWQEGSMLLEKNIDFEKFMELENKLFDLYDLGEDFKIGGGGKELWIKHSVICGECGKITQKEVLEDMGHCEKCEAYQVKYDDTDSLRWEEERECEHDLSCTSCDLECIQ